MKKKNYLIPFLVVMLIFSMGIFGMTQNSTYRKASLKVSNIPQSLSELTKQSDSIVIGVAEDRGQVFEYEGVTFYLTKVNIEKNYYGIENKSILLLQTYSYEEPIIGQGQQTLLFLSKYSGPIIDKENVYVCNSLGYSQYLISKDEVVSAINDTISNNIAKEIDNLDFLERNIYDYK